MYTTGPDYYFFWGREALDAIHRLMALVGVKSVNTILDMPCGYGRVMRFIRASFPEAVITACDIETNAAEFCARTFGARPLHSSVELETVSLGGAYDLIWCGSLLTHLPAIQWRALLTLFSRHLSDPGLLLFTTCGPRNADLLLSGRNTFGLTDRSVAAILASYEQDGFGFENYPRIDGYGLSLSKPNWVCSQIERVSGLELRVYQVGGWGGIQDVVACTKVPISGEYSSATKS